MSRARRPRLTTDLETPVLTKCLRRCCLCYCLENDRSYKRGQIAHLDGDRENNDPDNLAYLCLPHHDEYDSRTSQSKGLTIAEVKYHREELYKQLGAERGRKTDSDALKGMLQQFGFVIASSPSPTPPAMARTGGGFRTYIDGESHYWQCLSAWCRIHGNGASLERLRSVTAPDESLVLVLPEARVFWTRWLSPGQQSVYFTSVPARSSHHRVSRALRDFGLTPDVEVESDGRVDERDRRLHEQRVIEKPGGRDAAISVRILTEAQNGEFDQCNLYTSDRSYLPLIRALQAMQKVVIVHGFRAPADEGSELEHVPGPVCRPGADVVESMPVGPRVVRRRDRTEIWNSRRKNASSASG